MNHQYVERAQEAGFFGGTLTGFIANLSAADVISTVVLSAVGAVVSFFVSFLMKRLFLRKGNQRNRMDRADYLDGEKP